MIALIPRARVLVVDDDPGICRAVSRILGQHHDVVSAPGTVAALAVVASFVPDVAFIDIRMPEMNGFELMRRLHVVLPDLDVILMTGNADEPDANLVQAIDAGAFYFIQKPFERQVLLALATRCLELRRLREERQRYMHRMEKDLAQAQQFQRSMLPPLQTNFHGLSICARYVACHELAGDFYDYVVAGDDAVAVLIADVVGHGTSAAMMTSIVKSAFHAASVDGFDPACVIGRIQDGIRAFDADRFITLCVARIDVRKRQLSYANAGHPPGILRRRAVKPILLSPTGPLISSAFGDIGCEKIVLNLNDDDVVLFYTDGVTEVQGSDGMFGQERMVSLVARNGCPGPQLLDDVLSAVTEFSAGRRIQDDMTLLAVEIGALASSSERGHSGSR